MVVFLDIEVVILSGEVGVLVFVDVLEYEFVIVNGGYIVRYYVDIVFNIVVGDNGGFGYGNGEIKVF